MVYKIVYRSALRRASGWIPKVAYIVDGMPAILEGDPDCPYNTRDEALAAIPQLEAILRARLAGTGAAGAPPLFDAD